MDTFNSLSWSSVSSGLMPVDYRAAGDSLTLDSPATSVVVDFVQHRPIYVHAKDEAGRAEFLLEAVNARWACVLNGEEELVGTICLRDLNGHRSTRIAQQLDTAWKTVPIDYLMTPIAELPLVTSRQLQHARIGDVVATLQKSGHDFLLVQGDSRISGLISSWSVGERIGSPVTIHHRVSSFADIVHAVAHPNEAD